MHGVIAHPGTAKDKLVNAVKRSVSEILAALPKAGWSRNNEKRQGFCAPGLQSAVSPKKRSIDFIIVLLQATWKT